MHIDLWDDQVAPKHYAHKPVGPQVPASAKHPFAPGVIEGAAAPDDSVDWLFLLWEALSITALTICCIAGVLAIVVAACSWLGYMPSTCTPAFWRLFK